MRKTNFVYGAALLFYGGLAFLVLYPILFTTGVKVAGFDFFNYNWNFWWIRHVFTTPGLNVYQNDFVFYPLMNNFGYHALTAFWYPLWAVVEPLFGTLTAVNVIIFTGCVLNGFLLFAWMRSEGVHPALALIGGAALQVLPISRYFYYNTHLNLMDWWWLPALLLLWKQLVRFAEARQIVQAVVWAAIFGAAIWGLGLTDLQFPIFAAAFLIPYGLWTLWRSPGRFALMVYGVIAVVVGVGLLWFAGPLPYMVRFSGTLAPGPAEQRPGVPFPLGFFSMSDQWWMWDHPSLGAFVTTALLITLVAWVLIKPTRKMLAASRINTPPLFWLLVAIPPFLLSLGADLHIGDVTIPLPFRALHAITNGMFRMPWRMAPIYVIAAMLVCGMVWTARLHKVTLTTHRKARIAFGFSAVFLVLAISVRLFEGAPLLDAPTVYTAYQAMGAERGGDYDRYMVLEVPPGVGTGEVLLGDERAIQLQWYGMTHEKRGINGFVSRSPLDPLWDIYTVDPLWAWLGERAPLDEARVESLLRERVFDYPIGYMVIHTTLLGADPNTLPTMLGFFNRLDDVLCPPFTEQDIIVYRTRWHPDGCAPRVPTSGETNVSVGSYALDIGGDDNAIIGEGWSWREQIFDLTSRWMGREATIYVDLSPNAMYALHVSAQAFHENRTITVRVNGQAVGDPVTVAPDAFQTFSFLVSSDLLGNGEHVAITLEADDTITPSEIGQGDDTRPLSIMVDEVLLQSPSD
ncbi:MAG: hypothetical protein U0670_08480 [Anaerolineae bacterium]